jgi:hypothetical protein
MHQAAAEVFEPHGKLAQAGDEQQLATFEERAAAVHGSGRQLTGTNSPQDGLDVKALEQRQGRIERRIADLQARRLPDEIANAEDRLAVAYQHAGEAQAAAYQALIACRDAFLRGAQAHDRAAGAHELAADAGHGELATHRQMIEFHRAAAKADRRRAEQLTEDIGEAEAVQQAAQSDIQTNGL